MGAMSLVVSQTQSQSPFFIPAGLSPGGLLESPAMFSPNLGSFGISHQQALAQVTAQASQSHSHMYGQAEFPSSHHTTTTTTVTQPTGGALNMASYQHIQPATSDANNMSFESGRISHCTQRTQPPAVVVDKPVDDGYNWRKYGQKQVKGSEYPRSYYKCTHPNCPVKKKVERSVEGQVTEIIYKGQHNHQKPPPNKRAKESSSNANGSNEISTNQDYPDNADTISQSKRDRESCNETCEQLSGSSDGEEVGNVEVGQDEVGNSEPDPKRRVIDGRATESTSSHRTVTEPRIIVQTTSEVDLLDDGYRWRKYGQKVVKGNPHPRSYYKCTSAGCNVRKHVERASTDSKAVITTYEGKHNHDVPAARNSSHNTACSSNFQPKPHNPIPNHQAFPRREDLRNTVHRPVAVLQLKEEHNMP
ncbi:uncharacterized protein A4U43_C07F30020 [Asparagus officinalis]|uniref:WRKY domain-containing protein n=1 Tax=Asparagus officinalis TaxID=4686 RepID=A0A5P1EHZ6_ASPOF|nr:uncharacterized protein A4U43_C07F30020 [Asparagus officinalis]